MSLDFSNYTAILLPMFARYVIMIIVLITIGMWFYPEAQKPTLQSTPNVSFQLADGSKTNLYNYGGKTLLVHFWASWCPPCLPEIPELVKLAKNHPDDLIILTFSLDKSAQTMQNFMKVKFGELPKNFISIWDEKGSIAREEFHSFSYPERFIAAYDEAFWIAEEFHSFSYPESFIIGCDKSLREKIIGAASNWEKSIAPHLDKCSSS